MEISRGCTFLGINAADCRSVRIRAELLYEPFSVFGVYLDRSCRIDLFFLDFRNFTGFHKAKRDYCNIYLKGANFWICPGILFKAAYAKKAMRMGIPAVIIPNRISAMSVRIVLF